MNVGRKKRKIVHIVLSAYITCN